jgi:hypothetical protein
MSEFLSQAGFFHNSVSCVTASDISVHGDVLAGHWIDPSLVIAFAMAFETPSGLGQ